MSKFDYTKVYDHKLYKFIAPIGRIIMRCLFSIKLIGEENLPAEGGYILASNHNISLDPIILSMNKKRTIHFMAKEELFNNAIGNFFITRFNAFPIKRGSSDKASLQYAINVVKEGFVLGIFPEGTCSKDFIPKKPKSGVALIANLAQADVMPVSIYIEKNKKLRKKFTIRFGKMIKYEELGFSDDAKSTAQLRYASRKIFDEIVELWRLGH